MKIDAKLDLVLNKVLDVTPEQVWKAWTTPEKYGEWFCPVPWKVVEARLDLRPGGEFTTIMQSPEGDKFPGTGCILEVVPNKKLVWTSALLPDYRPAAADGMFFTATILLEAQGHQTKYIAIARHGSEEGCQKHREMGFEQGWGICADQLVAMMKK
jgi:uncharacterized protein YndB with AHSA1/START domain